MRFRKDPFGTKIYAFEFPFDKTIIERLKKVRGGPGGHDLIFKNDAWRFSDLRLISKIKEEFSEFSISIDQQIESDLVEFSLKREKEFERLNRIYELKNTMESDLVLKNIKTDLGTPWPFQKVGIEFMIETGGRCILADDMGSGKTLQTLCYLAHTGAEKVLVVCPAIAKDVWYDETLKWTHYRPLVLSSKTDLTMDMWNGHDIFIINYDIIGTRVNRKTDEVQENKFTKFFNAVRIDALVADECHRIKNPESARTKAVVALSRRIPRFIGTSGTPLLNRPIELYTTLNIIDPQEWPNYYSFAKRYCAKDGENSKTIYRKNKKTGKTMKRVVLETDGASNIDELRKRIGSYYLRRPKSVILPFLPERIESDIAIELDPETAQTYREAEKDFVNYLKEKKSQTFGANEFTRLNELRRLSSIGKIEQVTEFIEDLKDDQKVIVFSSFNEPLRQLRDYFEGECVYVTGEIETSKRKSLCSKFCNDPECRIFLGGTISAGESLTLVEARSTIFIDYPWVPGQRDQAADRNHRPGAEKLHDSLNIYQMYTKGTVDEKMRQIIYSKRKIFDALFAEKPGEAEFSAQREIINAYRLDKS